MYVGCINLFIYFVFYFVLNCLFFNWVCEVRIRVYVFFYGCKYVWSRVINIGDINCMV